jgi:hypothetical protein
MTTSFLVGRDDLRRHSVVEEPGSTPDDLGDGQALLQPLFMTSFVLDDWLVDSDLFGAELVVLGSASSKTAIGLAHLLTTNQRARVVGLTSERNAEFVRGTVGEAAARGPGGLHHEVRGHRQVAVDPLAGFESLGSRRHDDLAAVAAEAANRQTELALPPLRRPDTLADERGDFLPTVEPVVRGHRRRLVVGRVHAGPLPVCLQDHPRQLRTRGP